MSDFVKSSFSGGNGGNCVEWAFASEGVRVRDTKNPDGPELLFTRTAWDALTAAVATGAPHPSVVPGPHDVRLDTLTFTHAEWRAFTAATRAGETHRTPAAAH